MERSSNIPETSRTRRTPLEHWYFPIQASLSLSCCTKKYVLQDFTKFEDVDFTFPDKNKAETLRHLLSNLTKSYLDDHLTTLPDFNVICDTETEKTIEFTLEGYACRITQFRDVLFSDPSSYSASTRAREVETKSAEKMSNIEGMMGRAVANYMMALAMLGGDSAPDDAEKNSAPDDVEKNKKKKKLWYKKLRISVTREFWVERSSKEREELRQSVRDKAFGKDLSVLIAKIEAEDRSHT